MDELKPGWRRVKFGDVVRLVKDTCRDPTSAGIERVIGLEHLEPGDLRIRSWANVTDGTTFTSRVRPGQVLFGKRRAYQRKVAVADFDAICSGDIYVFESSDPSKLLPILLPFICLADAFFEHAVGTSAGSLSPRTNWSSLAKYELALPPLEAQARIYRQISAFEEVWRAADYFAGCARIAFHSTIEHLFETAFKEWPSSPLIELVEDGRSITYGILMPGTGHPGGVPVIKVKDFPNGDIDQSDLLLTSPHIAHEYRRSSLRSDDLLVSIRGTIGRIAVVPHTLDGANITQDTARLSFPSNVNVGFARAMLESASMQRMLRSNIPPPAPAGMPPTKARPRPTIQGLNIGELRRVAMPVPPRTIQDDIAEAASMSRHAMRDAASKSEAARNLWRLALEAILSGDP